MLFLILLCTKVNYFCYGYGGDSFTAVKESPRYHTDVTMAQHTCLAGGHHLLPRCFLLIFPAGSDQHNTFLDNFFSTTTLS
jgi:hypothetical protein